MEDIHFSMEHAEDLTKPSTVPSSPSSKQPLPARAHAYASARGLWRLAPHLGVVGFGAARAAGAARRRDQLELGVEGLGARQKRRKGKAVGMASKGVVAMVV